MQPLFLFAHGAGAGSTSLWMRRFAGRLEALGPVVTFDYPYVREGRRRPDRLPVLVEAHRAALAGARASHPGRPVVLAGKSMGSRIGCHLVLERSEAAGEGGAEPVRALICFGYPLVSPGPKRTVRDEVLLALRTPILFVQGTRDPLCPPGTLAEVRARMAAPSELLVVDDGDHSLRITKRREKREGVTQDQEEARVIDGVAAFLARLG